MLKFSEFIEEAIKKLNDEKMDATIKDEFNGDVITFAYDTMASIELAKVLKDVLITKDKKFMHISALEAKNKKVQDLITKYKLVKIDKIDK